MPELFTAASCRKDRKRISTESPSCFSNDPVGKRTEQNCTELPLPVMTRNFRKQNKSRALIYSQTNVKNSERNLRDRKIQRDIQAFSNKIWFPVYISFPQNNLNSIDTTAVELGRGWQKSLSKRNSKRHARVCLRNDTFVTLVQWHYVQHHLLQHGTFFPVPQILSRVILTPTLAAPQYLQELIPGYLPVHHLQSSTQSHLCIAGVDQGKNKKHFGVGAFFCAAPKLWNSLLISLREHNWKETFKKNLKTYLFSEN